MTIGQFNEMAVMKGAFRGLVLLKLKKGRIKLYELILTKSTWKVSGKKTLLHVENKIK